MLLRVSFVVLAAAASIAGCATDPDSRKSGDTAVSLTADQNAGASSSGIKGTDPTGQGIAAGESLAGREDRGELRRSVYYEFDKFDVKPEYRALVERHAAWLHANPRARLVVTGNTDERGPSEYNLALGQKRAESVTRMLVMLGAKAEQIEAVSFGKEKPRATGHDEAAWAENRRADFAQP